MNSDTNKEKNYYDILEVPTDATQEVIYDGYIKTKNAYSQDSLALYSLMGEEDCERMIEQIDEAYSILGDPQKRQKYDSARGLNSYKHQLYREKTDLLPKAEDVSFGEKSPQSRKHTSTALAKKRFTLDYQVNETFEKEIEQTSDFTGAFLKKIREYKGVDIPRLADLTKVSKTYLRHIEEEYIEGLPAMVYTRGFVYQYAKCLKLNPDMVATSYIHRLKKLKDDASK